MTDTLILIERRKSIAVVTLNRAAQLNALSRAMITTLSVTFESFAKDNELRAVILTGAGAAFCAGTDIGELAATNDNEGARLVSERGQALCDQVERCPVPVIAAINGIAAGGGCELALACHLRLVARNAQFSLPETKLGMIPAYGGTQRLPREAGYGRALELMLTGKTIDAERAVEFGLANRVVNERDLMTDAEALANTIAQLAPLAIRACLRAVVEGNELPLAEGLALETHLFSELFTTEDMREGTRAFLEKRAPSFKGT
jgi:enoyl-CoA hydratase